MRRITRVIPLYFLVLILGYARQDPIICGTNRERLKEHLQLHRQSQRKLRALRALAAAQGQAESLAPSVSKDVGEIAILDDSDGVVARLNEFNLDQKTVTFTPAAASAARYRIATGAGSYDSAAASSGAIAGGLADDDKRQYSLKFPFPFFGAAYGQVFVNSDGNLTFTDGDGSSSERSLGRMTAGPPRIAGLYRDLDPSMSAQGVSVYSAPDRFVVSWIKVPEYADIGTGPLQTFQVRLFPDGRIELAYAGINTTSAMVGISPGKLQGATSVISFVAGSSQEFSGTVAERFGKTSELDVVTAAQKFYSNHDDAYDFLVFFNNLGISAGDTAVSWEMTVRNKAKGYGDTPVDIGADFGSPNRLQAVLNMGPLSQYPDNPNGPVLARLSSRDTPLSIIAHEAGHRFLAYASVQYNGDPRNRPMVGFQGAHWSFVFNSEASLLEGNRIRDNFQNPQPGMSQRFSTVGVTEGFSPLDQYLMGLRAPEDVENVFVAMNPTVSPMRHPQVGVNFDGERLDISVADLIAAEGRRTPDWTVAQRRFRFAFVLVTSAGADPSPADIAKLDAFRQQFETYFHEKTGQRAWADSRLRRALRLSCSPAAGVVQGGSATASVILDKPAEAPLIVDLRTENGAAQVPSSVTVAAGATRATFTIKGVKTGVEELSASPSDARYETGYARIQVASSPADLKIVVVSGEKQAASDGVPLRDPVVLRVVDLNELPYQGVALQASVTAGGTLTGTAVTDENGEVAFRWTPGAAASNVLTASVSGAPSTAVEVAALGKPAFAAASVVNAATFQSGISPGSLASIFGINISSGTTATAGFPLPNTLADVTLLVNGSPAPLLMVSDGQVNFLVPPGTPTGTASFAVTTLGGTSTTVQVPVLAYSPGIFFDPVTTFGAILVSGTGQTTAQRPAARGEFLEIFGTGLGTVHADGGLQWTDATPRVFIGGVPADVKFNGLAPGYQGLYQVNAQVPSNVPSGTQDLYLTVGEARSNTVKVQIQ